MIAQKPHLGMTKVRVGFTIIEVLVALTASLLIMLALTQAFKTIGDKVTASQAELELSGTLRSVAFSIRDELNRKTVKMEAPRPKSAADGYFTYYEGPWTDKTTALIHHVTPTTRDPAYMPLSRYGDIDDYLAFTTKAKQGTRFQGMVPRGIIEAKRFAEFFSVTGSSASFVTLDGIAVSSYTVQDALELVPIYSDYAEVAYFCAPDWQRDLLGQPVYDNNGYPLFVDNTNETGNGVTGGDNVPDRLRLYRRIMLIRPDLNMRISEMARYGSAYVFSGEDQPQLPLLIPVGGPPATLRIVPLGSQAPQFSPGYWHPNNIWPSSMSATDNARPPWLTGMARIAQSMDLSVNRMTSRTSTGIDEYGMPKSKTDLTTPGDPNVAANDLRDLARPENRFGFVRMPRTNTSSTMPLLALCPPHSYLTNEENYTRSNSPQERFGQAGRGPGASTAYNPLMMVGFLRPEYVLTDYTLTDRSDPTTAVATYRAGTDVIASDVLSFDVQVLDPSAPKWVWIGSDPNNVPGNVGDDDGNGVNENPGELGWSGSNDVIVDVNSLNLRPYDRFVTAASTPSVFQSTKLLPTVTAYAAGAEQYAPTVPGGFVDFGYARLAGGPMGGFGALGLVPSTPPGKMTEMALAFTSTYSGGVFASDGAGGIARAFSPPSWELSGRYVLGLPSALSTDSFVQPIIDTWTDSYDGDGFNQSGLVVAPPSFTVTGSPILPTPPSLLSGSWTNATESANASGGFSGFNGALVESTPPTSIMPRAIKITVRVYSRATGAIRQECVIQYFDE